MGSFKDWLTGMNISERAAKWASIAVMVLLVAGIGAAALALSRCSDNHQKAAQGWLEAEQDNAFADSVGGAIAIQEGAVEREKASEDLTRDNDRDIHVAEGSGDKVNPAVKNAGIKALCKRSAYANDPRCRRL